jgi:hypothetical protein
VASGHKTSASQQIFVTWLGNQKKYGGLAWIGLAWFFAWLGFWLGLN